MLVLCSVFTTNKSATNSVVATETILACSKLRKGDRDYFTNNYSHQIFQVESLES